MVEAEEEKQEERFIGDVCTSTTYSPCWNFRVAKMYLLGGWQCSAMSGFIIYSAGVAGENFRETFFSPGRESVSSFVRNRWQRAFLDISFFSSNVYHFDS